MKQQTFYFSFQDEPQFKTTMGRAELANKLRSYRKQKHFKLHRVWQYHYLVRVIGSAAVAEITPA